MRKSMRAWVSLDVNPWIRPKKTKVSLMVNSLYNARSCGRRHTHGEDVRLLRGQ